MTEYLKYVSDYPAFLVTELVKNIELVKALPDPFYLKSLALRKAMKIININTDITTFKADFMANISIYQILFDYVSIVLEEMAYEMTKPTFAKLPDIAKKAMADRYVIYKAINYSLMMISEKFDIKGIIGGFGFKTLIEKTATSENDGAVGAERYTTV